MLLYDSYSLISIDGWKLVINDIITAKTKKQKNTAALEKVVSHFHISLHFFMSCQSFKNLSKILLNSQFLMTQNHGPRLWLMQGVTQDFWGDDV